MAQISQKQTCWNGAQLKYIDLFSFQISFSGHKCCGALEKWLSRDDLLPSCNVNTNDAPVTKWEMLGTSSCEHLLQHLLLPDLHVLPACLASKKERVCVRIGNVVKYKSWGYLHHSINLMFVHFLTSWSHHFFQASLRKRVHAWKFCLWHIAY